MFIIKIQIHGYLFYTLIGIEKQQLGKLDLLVKQVLIWSNAESFLKYADGLGRGMIDLITQIL